MSIDKNLLCGTYRTLFLKLLSQKDMCGAEIVRELREKTDDILKIKAGSLYPVLQKLEREGYLSSEFMEGYQVRSRRVYSITPAGRAFLADKTEEWHLFVKTVTAVLVG